VGLFYNAPESTRGKKGEEGWEGRASERKKGRRGAYF